jgi:hypothetical protein
LPRHSSQSEGGFGLASPLVAKADRGAKTLHFPVDGPFLGVSRVRNLV